MRPQWNRRSSSRGGLPKSSRVACWNLGIGIPTLVANYAKTGLSELDFAKLGSLNLMVPKFPRAIPPYHFLNEITDIREKGQVRPDAFIFLRKDKSGKISRIEGSGLHEDDDIAVINVVISTITSRSFGVALTLTIWPQAIPRATKLEAHEIT